MAPKPKGGAQTRRGTQSPHDSPVREENPQANAPREPAVNPAQPAQAAQVAQARGANAQGQRQAAASPVQADTARAAQAAAQAATGVPGAPGVRPQQAQAQGARQPGINDVLAALGQNQLRNDERLAAMEQRIQRQFQELHASTTDLKVGQDNLQRAQEEFNQRLKAVEEAQVPEVPTHGLHDEPAYLGAARRGHADSVEALTEAVYTNEHEAAQITEGMGLGPVQAERLLLRPQVAAATSDAAGVEFSPAEHPEFPWRNLITWRPRVLTSFRDETLRLRAEAVMRGVLNVTEIVAPYPQPPTAVFDANGTLVSYEFPNPPYARAAAKRPTPVSDPLPDHVLAHAAASSDVVVLDALDVAGTQPVVVPAAPLVTAADIAPPQHTCTCCLHAHASSGQVPVAPVHAVHQGEEISEIPASKRPRLVIVQPATLPQFSGIEDDGIPDANVWITDVQEESERLQEPLLTTLKRHTVGTAKDWVLQRIAATVQISDAELVTQFHSVFGGDRVTKRDQALYKLQFGHLSQGKLTVMQYFAKFHTLCTQAEVDTTQKDTRLCLQFVGGLKPSLRKAHLTEKATGSHYEMLSKVVESCKLAERKELDARRSDSDFKSSTGTSASAVEEGTVNMLNSDPHRGRGRGRGSHNAGRGPRNEVRDHNKKTHGSFRAQQEPPSGGGWQQARGHGRGGRAGGRGPGRGRGRGPPEAQEDSVSSRAIAHISRARNVSLAVARGYYNEFRQAQKCLFCGGGHYWEQCPERDNVMGP